MAGSSRQRFVPAWGMVVAFASFFGALGVGVAQEATTVGGIDATMDGAERAWRLVEVDTEEGTLSTATWASIMDRFYLMELQGVADAGAEVEDSLVIEATLLGVPEACPCTTVEPTVTYFSESSLENMYLSGEGGTATVTLTSFEALDDGSYRVEGTFEADMPRVATLGAEPDMTDVIPVTGTFHAERLTPLDAGGE